MRVANLIAALTLAAGLLAPGSPARADVMILLNGDHLVGKVDVSEFQLITPGGTVQFPVGQVLWVTLGAIQGDVVALRTGSIMAGRLDLPQFTIRLDSGHEVPIARYRIAKLLFLPR